jgi:hypothetical protein
VTPTSSISMQCSADAACSQYIGCTNGCP